MKFVVTWKVRSGASAADNEAAAARTLEVFGKWSPPSDETFHQFLGRLDGTGGFAVVETDNPDSLAEAPAKFGTYLDFEIIPVNDITETTLCLVRESSSVRGSSSVARASLDGLRTTRPSKLRHPKQLSGVPWAPVRQCV